MSFPSPHTQFSSCLLSYFVSLPFSWKILELFNCLCLHTIIGSGQILGCCCSFYENPLFVYTFYLIVFLITNKIINVYMCLNYIIHYFSLNYFNIIFFSAVALKIHLKRIFTSAPSGTSNISTTASFNVVKMYRFVFDCTDLPPWFAPWPKLTSRFPPYWCSQLASGRWKRPLDLWQWHDSPGAGRCCC